MTTCAGNASRPSCGLRAKMHASVCAAVPPCAPPPPLRAPRSVGAGFGGSDCGPGGGPVGPSHRFWRSARLARRPLRSESGSPGRGALAAWLGEPFGGPRPGCPPISEPMSWTPTASSAQDTEVRSRASGAGGQHGHTTDRTRQHNGGANGPPTGRWRHATLVDTTITNFTSRI